MWSMSYWLRMAELQVEVGAQVSAFKEVLSSFLNPPLTINFDITLLQTKTWKVCLAGSQSVADFSEYSDGLD
uniref:Ovule protein n=1 Tax=Syphacia muris TaxID=451379 RepID=A0A0N5AA56_9BILA